MATDSRAAPAITDEMLNAAVAVYETRDSRVEFPEDIVRRILVAALATRHRDDWVDGEFPIKSGDRSRKRPPGGSEN